MLSLLVKLTSAVFGKEPLVVGKKSERHVTSVLFCILHQPKNASRVGKIPTGDSSELYKNVKYSAHCYPKHCFFILEFLSELTFY